jgi:predicted RNA methylase
MALNDVERKVAIRLLSGGASSTYETQRELISATPEAFIYLSANRPFWIGFDKSVEADAGFVGYRGDMVETSRAASLDFLNRLELTPISDKAMTAIAAECVGNRATFALRDQNSSELSVAWVHDGGALVAKFDIDKPGSPVLIAESQHASMAAAVIAMAAGGGKTEIEDRYVFKYLNAHFDARRFVAELTEIGHGRHPAFAANPSDIVANASEYLSAFVKEEPKRANEVATAIANALASDPETFSVETGVSPDQIKQLADQLTLATKLANEKIEIPNATPKQRWVDLGGHGIYLGDQKMADGRQRLVLIDMQDRADPQKLREIGFVPVTGSPKYDKGIYCLKGDDQRLRPKALAAALGVSNCPLVDVDASEISRVFGDKMREKFGVNLNAVMLRSRNLGQNGDGQYVHESGAGRFIRLSTDSVLNEGSPQAKKLSGAVFLRASNDEELRRCAEGFLWTIRQGGKTTWPDLVRFGNTVFASERDTGPTSDQMHRLQEALEAVSYRHFTTIANRPDEVAFKAASDFYFGLPVARMRTSESIFLQQYSTPLPMSVIAQRVLLGNDLTADKTLLEPTGGNGGLVNLMPKDLKVYAVELDTKRVQALNETGRVRALAGDATQVVFQRAFGVYPGFDYTIANPPFGQMDQAKAFDKINSIRKVDHYIALRALEARKDVGRSVVIFAADSTQSDGTIKGGSRAFLNYIHDHYEVHGVTEIDGRLYSRQGSGLNVRMLVIGDKRPESILADAPEKLKIITTYEELWQWSDHVIASYAPPRPAIVAQAAMEVGARVRFTAHDAGDLFSVGIVEGLVVNADSTSGGNIRYRIRTDKLAPQGGGNLETLVYSHQGSMEPMPEPPEPTQPIEPAEASVSASGFDAATPIFDVGRESVINHASDTAVEVPAQETEVGVEIGDSVFVRGGQYEGTVRTYLGKSEKGFEVSDTLMGKIIVPGVEFHRKANDLALPVVEVVSEDKKTVEEGKPTPPPESTSTKEIAVEESAPDPVETPKSTVVVADAMMTTPEPVIVPSPVKQPWQMTLQEWDTAVNTERNGGSIGGFTRNAGSQMAARFEQLEVLRYGVIQWAREKFAAAQKGDIKITKEELDEITERLDTPVTHRDVVNKALLEGKNVPKEVLADYPDLCAPPQRNVNEFQVPYQAASRVGEPSTMIPINMAGATYAALNDLESRFGPIDNYVATKLQYPLDELPKFFSAEQVDALGLCIKSVEDGRGVINADQTGIGKGRFVAAMIRYAKLNNKTPVFLTIKPELFTDIFRDISDIGSQDLFKKLFIFNNGEYVRKFGTAKEVLHRATTALERKDAIAAGGVPEDTDLVLASYSQFMRAHHKNPKASLLTQIVQNNGMLILDEAHVASGASNLAATVGQAVVNSDAVVYASATPLKGISNFAIYSKIFPASVDLQGLPDTLKAGGEALLEAISANMARDGVLIRREHDYSKLTFNTRVPDDARCERNISLANSLADIVASMSYMAGDVASMVKTLNKSFVKEWEEIPVEDRAGSRMQASSMNFGSRLYSLNRQFLLGIKIEEAVDAALASLEAGRKPVIAVENTGESLLRQVIARRAGVEHLEAELVELDESSEALTPEQKARRGTLVSSINDAMRNVVLTEPPQFRELLDAMLDRIGLIKVQGRYGDVQRAKPSSKEYAEEEDRVRKKIEEFPDLALTPIDIVKKELQKRGHHVGEVSGRTASIVPNEMNPDSWDVQFHSKVDAVSNVANFQNGKSDAIVITRSGSTGISLHATDRFDDSDIRQREFITLQKAANIAEYLQWLGRVNRKDQVIPPVLTGLDSGLPAESRLTMMHDAKLRKLSANTTSNRANENMSADGGDLLNEVGEQVALEWLSQNPDMAERLDIKLPRDEDEEEAVSRYSQDCPYINKLMGRLLMVNYDTQVSILKSINDRFAERIEELEQRGENPFKVDVYDWKAKVTKIEELQSGVIRCTSSTFDDPVNMVTLTYEQDVFPIRAKKLQGLITAGLELFAANGVVDKQGSLNAFRNHLSSVKDDWVRGHLPNKLRDSELPLAEILGHDNVTGAVGANDKATWLLANISAFRPGIQCAYDDTFKGEQKGIITSVELPHDKSELFLLSKYRAKVAFPGEDHLREITLATMRSQGKELAAKAWLDFDPSKLATSYNKRHVQLALDEFDDAPDGKVTRTQLVLQGNIFRSCELANKQKLGSPILYTDAEGNRQRAVLLRSYITAEMVKSIPIGLDAKDLGDYVEEYLRPNHPEHHNRIRFCELQIFDAAVKTMKSGEGIKLELSRGGSDFLLTIPGTKARAGSLLSDGSIFNIGEKTGGNSLGLKLSGTRASMSARVDRADFAELLTRLQINHHVGKFYIPDPDTEVIAVLKARYALSCRVMPMNLASEPSP